MKKCFLTVSVINLLCISLCLPIYAKTKIPPILTLREAIALSLRFNPSMQTKELQRIIDKYALVAAKNEFEPQYTLKASYQYARNEANQTSSIIRYGHILAAVGKKTHYGTQVTVSSDNPVTNSAYRPALVLDIAQPLIRGFGKPVVEAALNNAFDQEDISKLSLKESAISTVNDVITKYFSLVQAKETLKTDQLSLQGYEKTVSNEKEMIKAGRIPQFDLIQAQTQVAKSKSAIQNDSNNIHIAYLQLLDTIGLPNSAKIKIPDHINFDQIARTLMGGASLPSLPTSKRYALSNNIAYQVEGFSLKQINRNLILAKDKNRWKLDLTARASAGGSVDNDKYNGFQNFVKLRDHTESVGLELSIPIDDVSAKQALIDARVSLNQADINYKELKRQLDINVTNYFTTVNSDREQLRLTKEALILQRKTVELAELKRKAGRISTFEYLKDRQDLTEQEQAVVNDQINYINSLVTFDQELGTTLDHWNIKIRY